MPFVRRGSDSRTSEQKKKEFLEKFREIGIVTAACKSARVGRTAVYEWEKLDPEFAAEWKAAEPEAIENLEAEAFRRAVKGTKQRKSYFYKGGKIGEDVVTEYSDTLLIFLLKGRAPEKYRERQDITMAGVSRLRIDLGNDGSNATTDH